jgi:hypothetical protein
LNPNPAITLRKIQFHRIQLTHNWKVKTQPTKEAPIKRFWTLIQQLHHETLNSIKSKIKKNHNSKVLNPNPQKLEKIRIPPTNIQNRMNHEVEYENNTLENQWTRSNTNKPWKRTRPVNIQTIICIYIYIRVSTWVGYRAQFRDISPTLCFKTWNG